MNPKTINDLIGPAKRVAEILVKKITSHKSGKIDKMLPVLLYGPPGTGKSTTAEIIALQMAGHPMAVERINGQEMTVDRVRDWRRNSPYRPLFGEMNVKMVDEIDQASKAALGELRTYLDTMQKGTCFIATTNKRPDELDESVQTRFYDLECDCVSTDDVVQYIMSKHSRIPECVAKEIAKHSQGNVRVAEIDAMKYEDAVLTE